jgi:hypothetical protein
VADRAESRLLELIAAVPPGEKLPLARFGREIDASQSVVASLIEGMIADGRIDRATLRPAIVAAGPVEAASPSTPVPTEGMAGGDLFELLVAEGRKRGMNPTAVCLAAFGNRARMFMLRDTRKVRAETIARARAWIDGTSDQGEGRAAPSPGGGAVPAPGSAGAGCSVDPSAPAERPTGAELAAEIEAAVAASGRTIGEFMLPISAYGATWVKQLALARRPKAETAERVRKLIAGELTAAAPRRAPHPNQCVRRADREALGLEPSRREIVEQRSLAALERKRGEEDEQRVAAERAAALRKPGETLAQAVAREAAEVGERRRVARKFGNVGAPLETAADKIRRLAGEIDDESLGDLRAIRQRQAERDCATPSALIRRATREWPELCGRIARIAIADGIGKAEAWRRALSAGVECLEAGE